MKRKLIGHVGVDSGQLLLCDPCYIDSEWEKENFADIRIYKNKVTQDTLTYCKDFPHYDSITKYGKSMNELIATGEWEEQERPSARHEFSYNACAHATLSKEGHGQLNYNTGNSGIGVAFRTAMGDGMYPVYAIYDMHNVLIKVEVHF